MKINAVALLLSAACAPALAAAQDTKELWTDLAETRPLALRQETGGQVVEEWYGPRVRASLSVFARASFPSNTEVTIDGLWYSDFFDWAGGFSAEADLLSFITPQIGVGGYLSVGWDRFYGNRLNFFNGDSLSVGDWDMETVIIGGKVVQHVSPFVVWEGRLGVGWVHYNHCLWSGVDTGVPFSDEELFRAINRAVFELGGRIGVGSRNFQVDFGFGFRYMGAAARGRDVTTFIDPDLLYTFMLELGLTVRF